MAAWWGSGVFSEIRLFFSPQKILIFERKVSYLSLLVPAHFVE